MLGAIIGDLAAWTWENNHGKFYPDLVSDNSQLSIYGRAMLGAASKALRPGSRNDLILPIGSRMQMGIQVLGTETHGGCC
jgi:hypothetical protein